MIYFETVLTTHFKTKDLVLNQINNLKNIFLLSLFCFCFSLVSIAQEDASAATLNNIQHLPAFTIYRVPDSSAFTNEQLKNNKPVVLMFFSPGCDHCQKETKELLAYKEELKGLQIIMASPAALAEIKAFYEDYNIALMNNITMGKDNNYGLGRKYQLKTYPSVFVYDASGTLAKAFIGNVSVPTILDAVK
jgi:thiol-disulfide isomerase/thioredoxin